MNRYGARYKGKTARRDTLTINDTLFINEYLANGQNGTRAYMKVHPNAKEGSARAEAARVLSKPCVTQELKLRVQAAGLTPQVLQTRLEHAWERAKELDDPSALVSVAMSQAKLAGYLVDRQEVKSVKDDEAQSVHRIVRDLIQAGKAEPTTEPAAVAPSEN